MSRSEYSWRIVIALVFAAVLFLAWQVRGILILTFGAIVIAVVIRMAADPLAHFFNMEERWAALAAVPGILLAFADSPTKALYAGLVYLVVQQLEGNLITPLAQRWAVRLPPALGLFAIVAFASLFGLPGLLFAAPLTIVLMALVRHLYLDEPVA